MSPEIAGRSVGEGAPVFVIAEIGLNHGGDVKKALDLVDAAAGAGAAAVKLQTLRAHRLVAAHCPPPAHVAASSLREFFRGFELDESEHLAVAERARSRGLGFMSTPFDEDAVSMLERVGCDAYKIASGDVTHLRLIERAASTRKPMIISTGMSTEEEVARALKRARAAGAPWVGLLHCVSAYPVPAGEENLRAITTLRDRFDVPSGLSDHSREPLAIAVAVALGGSLYERHVVLSHEEGAVDDAVSSTPAELADAVAAALRVALALGTGARVCGAAEAANRHGSRRGIYASRDLPEGHLLTGGDLVMLRPADGIDAARWREVIGKRLDGPVGEGVALPVSLLAQSGA